MKITDLSHDDISEIARISDDMYTISALSQVNRQFRDSFDYQTYLKKTREDFKNIEIILLPYEDQMIYECSKSNSVIFENDQLSIYKDDKNNLLILKTKNSRIVLKKFGKQKFYKEISFKVNKFVMINNLIHIIYHHKNSNAVLIVWDKFILYAYDEVFFCGQISQYKIKSICYSSISSIIITDENNESFAIGNYSENISFFRNGKIALMYTSNFLNVMYLTKSNIFETFIIPEDQKKELLKLLESDQKDVKKIYEFIRKYKDLNITRISNLDLSTELEISQSTKSCTNLIKIRENSEKFDSIKYKKLDNMI